MRSKLLLDKRGRKRGRRRRASRFRCPLGRLLLRLFLRRVLVMLFRFFGDGGARGLRIDTLLAKVPVARAATAHTRTVKRSLAASIAGKGVGCTERGQRVPRRAREGTWLGDSCWWWLRPLAEGATLVAPRTAIVARHSVPSVAIDIAHATVVRTRQRLVAAKNDNEVVRRLLWVRDLEKRPVRLLKVASSLARRAQIKVFDDGRLPADAGDVRTDSVAFLAGFLLLFRSGASIAENVLVNYSVR
mmetsp:Transcript_9289/g.13959  ORF Transcript_9289/g.13959 Transcript_9289/m.13959 type:complete len:245 (+) Transcript_9289:597-1331(+)